MSMAARLVGQLPSIPARVISAALRLGSVMIVQRGEGVVKVFQPVARKNPFRRDMAKPSPQMRDDGVLPRRAAGHCRMATLARKHEVAIGMRDAGRDPEPRTGAKRHERRPLDRLTAAYPQQLSRRQAGQRPGDRFKIIDQTDHGKSVGRAQFGGIDDPGIVGKGTAAVLDRAGNSKNCRADDAGLRQTAEISVESLAKAAEVADRQMGDVADCSVGQQRETCVGAADVREQHFSFREIRVHRRCAVLIRSAYQRNEALGMRRSEE